MRSAFLPRDLSFSDRARASAERRLARLSKKIPAASDQEIVAEIARIAALAGNAHTRAYLLRNRGWWRRYPLRIWHFSDGWFVIAVRPGYEALLGGRIERIGGKPIDEVLRSVNSLYAGPQTWASYMATYTLTSPDALLGTGRLHGDGRAAFVVRQGGLRRSVMVYPVEEPRRGTPEESWWFLSPASTHVEGWRHVLAGGLLPEYLSRPDQWYQIRHCQEDVLYLPFSRSENQPGAPTLAAFAKTVMDALSRSPHSRLIVDLRFNTGGNLQKTRTLFEQISRSSLGQENGRIYVILGPSTFSAGITPAALLRAGGKVILVGSKPGDRMMFWAEGGNLILPNSGITLHYADREHNYGAADDATHPDLVYLRLNARSLAPDLSAATSFGQYLEGRDAVMDRIIPSGLRCET